ncbi:MAG TPA: hypothetical protein PKI03_34830 [Pseudomonadota bacterium]|nr:hypothetical protein [Pseudomonadota bacterium]
MNRQILEMFGSAEGRYLTASEQSTLRDYAQGLEARLAAMSEISSKETTIVEQTVREIFRAYPDMEKTFKNAMQTCIRDETLVLRYTAMAMLRNDPQYLNDSLLTWLSTILRGVGFAPHFIEDTYKTLALVAGRELSPATAKLLHPFVLQCAAVLSGRESSDASKEAK